MPARWVITFESVYYVMKAEKLLKENGYDALLIPTPREISSDCGIAIELTGVNIDTVKNILQQNCPVQGIFPEQK